jgi:hypothetical protein
LITNWIYFPSRSSAKVYVIVRIPDSERLKEGLLSEPFDLNIFPKSMSLKNGQLSPKLNVKVTEF